MIFLVLKHFWDFGFGFGLSSLLCIVGELPVGGSVEGAVAVGDR